MDDAEQRAAKLIARTVAETGASTPQLIGIGPASARALAAEGLLADPDTARLRRLGEAAIDLLRYMTDTEDGNCSLDHHGYCQEHPGGFRWLDGQDRPKCWVAAAKKIVEEAGVEQ